MVKRINSADEAIKQKLADAGALLYDVGLATEAMQSEDPHLVTLSDGRQIRVASIPVFLQQRLARKYPDPLPPRVAVQTVEGEQMMDNPDDPDYLAAKKDMAAQRAQMFQDLVYIYAVQDEPPKEDDWVERLTYFGLDAPKNQNERKVLWCEAELLKSPVDLQRVIGAVMRLSGVTEGAISEMEDTFRRPA